MRFDFIYFDSGGTLYDIGADWDVTLGRVASESGKRVHALLRGMGVDLELVHVEEALTRQEQVCQQQLGAAYNFLRLMETVVSELELPLGTEDAACLADAYAGPRYASWLFPGTEDALRTLSESGYRLGIIANTPWPGFSMDRAFAGVGLLPYLNIRIYSGDVGIAKPDPAIFRLAEQLAGVAGKRVLFVGDDVENDIKGAAAVGWSTALRRSGSSTETGIADLEFDNISELLPYCLSQ